MEARADRPRGMHDPAGLTGRLGPRPRSAALRNRYARAAVLPILARRRPNPGTRRQSTLAQPEAGLNTLGPGLVVTQSNLESMKPSEQDVQNKWVSKEQIIEVAIFLVSSASDGVTGALLPVQGRGV